MVLRRACPDAERNLRPVNGHAERNENAAPSDLDPVNEHGAQVDITERPRHELGEFLGRSIDQSPTRIAALLLLAPRASISGSTGSRLLS
jgi:hypothetical protein